MQILTDETTNNIQTMKTKYSLQYSCKSLQLDQKFLQINEDKICPTIQFTSPSN